MSYPYVTHPLFNEHHDAAAQKLIEDRAEPFNLRWEVMSMYHYMMGNAFQSANVPTTEDDYLLIATNALIEWDL